MTQPVTAHDFHIGDTVRNRHTLARLTVTAEGIWLTRFYELVACPHDVTTREYFVAPNAYGDTALWRRTSDPDTPEEIVTREALESIHEDLWPAVLAQFTRKGR